MLVLHFCACAIRAGVLVPTTRGIEVCNWYYLYVMGCIETDDLGIALGYRCIKTRA